MTLELAGLLLTVAMVGAVLIARRRVLHPDQPRVSVAIVAPMTPITDDPHSIPVEGTTNPRQKEYPEQRTIFLSRAQTESQAGRLCYKTWRKRRNVANPQFIFPRTLPDGRGIMFAIGLIGFITRRNLIVGMFLCTELMFQGVAINLIAFGAFHPQFWRPGVVIFVLVIAAAEAVAVLGMVVLLFRQNNTLDADAWRELRH